jgi:predicted RNA methylase
MQSESIGMPRKSFKTLMTIGSWTFRGLNWKENLSRSLQRAESWLRDHLRFHCCNDSRESFLCDDQYARRIAITAERKRREARPKKLQQYFSSERNVLALMQLLLKYSDQSDQLIIVEPSCGDGRIIRAIISNPSLRPVRIVGVDIDPTMEELAMDGTGSSRTSESSMNFICTDFLQTRSENIRADFCDEDVRVVVIGNPPFANSAMQEEDSDDEAVEEQEGDYTQQFLLHSAVTLDADLIVFLLPRRCSRSAFIDGVLEQMKSSSSASSNMWILAECMQADSSFELCGRIIYQPVVIMVWKKAKLSG